MVDNNKMRKGGIKMNYCSCPNCKRKCIIHENDTMPGCREMEDVFCPICHHLIDRVFTSGTPSVEIIKEDEYPNVEKEGQ